MGTLETEIISMAEFIAYNINKDIKGENNS